MPPLRVFVETSGCTANVGDGRFMEGLLAQAGHQLVSTAADADLVVLNTCTVVDATERRLVERMGALQREGKRLVVAGCMAAAQPRLVHEYAPDAPLVTPRGLHQIVDAVAGRPFVAKSRPKTRLPTLPTVDHIVPVAEGCFFSCTYCLTKSARGDTTSVAPDAIVADVREALARGAVEVKLTGQDVGGYGVDLGAGLPDLLRRLTGLGGDFRIRVGMMHPRTAHRNLDDLLDAMDDPKVYKFLHLPVQSGSPAVLRAMKRGHGLDEFWETVEAFRRRFPQGTVSTDIIVAFPGETEADHRMTLELLDRLGAEHVNVTRFSARPGTPAKEMVGRVSSQVAKRRSKEASASALAKSAHRYAAYVGRTMTVLAAEAGSISGTVVARGPGYEPVAVDQPIPLGSFLRVRIRGAHSTYLVASVTHPPSLPSQPASSHPDTLKNPARVPSPVEV